MNREFQLTEQDFNHIRRLIREHAGIALADSKQELVYSRLARRLRATNSKTFAEYLALLQQRGNETEWEAFINSLTTNLTSFFREPHHFPLLAEHLRNQDAGHAITLWCSACSTGEEAYSMAITAMETLGGRPFHIIASDLDTGVLRIAREGRYRIDAVRHLPPAQVERFFIRETGAHSGHVRVRPEVQKHIDFRRINLLDRNWPLHAPLDAIFCRNVMIYFDRETQLDVLRKFAPLLRPDGLLFAGHSESFHHAADIFRLRGRTVYELVNKH